MAEEQVYSGNKLQMGLASVRFEEIYRTYSKKIYNYVFSLIRHREIAEDITADVFVSVYRKFYQLDEERGSLSTWIYAIARNAVRDYKKRASFRREILGAAAEESGSEVGFLENGGKDDSLKNPENVWLQELLQQLTEEEVELLMLRYQMDLSNAEIGKITGLTVGAVTKRFSRLLEKCRTVGKQKG